jgi:hypothetical protein
MVQEVAMEHTTETATLRRSSPGGLASDLDETAARRVERWALVAGVTGCTANALLLALFTVALPGNHGFDWTGPANDVIGAVAGLTMIPMARGVRDLLGSPGRLPLLTRAVAVGGVAMAAASGLLVTGRIEFPVQAVVGTGFAVTLLLWTGSAGRWGAVTDVLPRRLARAARMIEGLGLVGLPLAAVGAALSRGSVAQYAVGGAGVGLVLASYLALPVWQILLSRAMSCRPAAGPLTGGPVP